MTLSKAVGDLQLGDKKVTLNHLVYIYIFILYNPEVVESDKEIKLLKLLRSALSS